MMKPPIIFAALAVALLAPPAAAAISTPPTSSTSSNGSKRSFLQELPLASVVATADQSLEDASEAGTKAARASTTVAAVLKVGQNMRELAADVKLAEKASLDAAHEAGTSEGVLLEVTRQRDRAAAALGRSRGAVAKLKQESERLVAKADADAGSVVREREEVTIKNFQDWKFSALHNRKREANLARFTAMSPYREAEQKVATALAKLRGQAAAADSEAFSIREEVLSLGETANARLHWWTRQADVLQLNQLKAKADQLAVRANNLAKEADKWALLLPRYQMAAEYVGAEAAQRIDPSVVMPPFSDPLPPVGSDLALPVL